MPRTDTSQVPVDYHPLLAPDRLRTWPQLIARDEPPKRPGCYAWYFDGLPRDVPTSGCHRVGDRVLAYVGIAPHERREGIRPSRATLRSRLAQHFRGNACGSTLRLTLGLLLRDELGLELRRVGRGSRMTFGEGEGPLSRWIDRHARVAFLENAEPWRIEEALLRRVCLPLNLEGNERHPFHATLSELRRSARAQARHAP
ncbi:MAG TPA: hypothetical protein VHF22_04935 [Planctomycetota bacterium]|nr:hypothetical protein [Planctomycetota bacterium]